MPCTIQGHIAFMLYVVDVPVLQGSTPVYLSNNLLQLEERLLFPFELERSWVL